jgi:DNA-binding NtrC family response regulator
LKRLKKPDDWTVAYASASAGQQRELNRLGSRWGWDIWPAAGLEEALELARTGKVTVVIVDSELLQAGQDGLLPALAERVKVIAALRFSEIRGWHTYIGKGAYDVLALPFEASEVFQVVSVAAGAAARERRGPRMETSDRRTAPVARSRLPLPS